VSSWPSGVVIVNMVVPFRWMLGIPKDAPRSPVQCSADRFGHTMQSPSENDKHCHFPLRRLHWVSRVLGPVQMTSDGGFVRSHLHHPAIWSTVVCIVGAHRELSGSNVPRANFFPPPATAIAAIVRIAGENFRLGKPSSSATQRCDKHAS
jgi:hypothetical protein